MRELQTAILAVCPAAEVEGRVGRRSSFEVTVNGSLVHTKLATMSFPDVEETVGIVQAVEAGGEPRKVNKMQEGGGCTIL